MSNYTATLQIGRIRFQIAADTERTLFERVSLFAEMPDRCGNPECQETNLQPRYRCPQGNDYYSLDCPTCGWRYTYGITKEDKKLFPHRKWEPPYQGNAAADDVPRRDTGRVPTQSGADRRRQPEADEADRREFDRQFPREEPTHRRTYGAGKPFGQH